MPYGPPPQGNNRRGPESDQRASLSDLNLTDSQKLKINIIKADEKRRTERIKEDILQIMGKKKMIIKSINFKGSDLKRIIEEYIKLVEKKEIVKMDSLLKIRKTLTDDKWKLYVSKFLTGNRNMNNQGFRPGGRMMPQSQNRMGN